MDSRTSTLVTRIVPLVTGLWLLGQLCGCQGGEVQTSTTAITVIGQVPQGKVATPLLADPICFADSDCDALILSPCARAICNPTTKRCEAGTLPDFATCDGGGLCAAVAACLSGVCIPVLKDDCDDDNPCTKDECDPTSGCAHSPENQAPCSDGNPCTIDDRCLNGGCMALDNLCLCRLDADCAQYANACIGTLICADNSCIVDSTTAPDCDDGNPCTKDVCDPTSGACTQTPMAANAPCDDGSVCTLHERCVQGACTASSKLPCAVNDDSCPTESCDPKAGCVPSKDGSTCDDGNACTTGDACSQGVCAGTSTCGCTDDTDCAGKADVPACLGRIACRAGRCEIDPNSAVPCAASSQSCVMNLCTAAGCKLTTAPALSPCDDNNACTYGDACDATAGCVAGSTLACDDGLACTVDACVVAFGCMHGPGADDETCDDGRACSTDDRCVGMQCVGTPSGCDDGDACTTDFCAPSGSGCIHRALTEGATCDDGDLCTSGDRCIGGLCQAQTTLNCDDSNRCTTDLCGPDGGCLHPATAAGESCDDDDACTVKDVCLAGACVGEKGSCQCENNADCGAFEDGDRCNGTLICQANSCVVNLATVVTCADSVSPCVQVSCQATTGLCTEKSAVLGTTCDDGNVCTSGERCLNGGACGGGAAVVCDDGDSCTIDSCAGGVGCSHVAAPVSLGIPCDDGNVCTQGDVCSAGACTSGKNTCQCTKNADCVAFDDGNLCNGKLRCEKGACVPDGSAVVCGDGAAGPCLAVGCQPQTGTCGSVAANDGTVCDDGDVCSGESACTAGLCVGSAVVACDDDNVCTVDVCDKTKGCTYAPILGGDCDDGNVCTAPDLCSALGACVGGFNTCECQVDETCAANDDGNPCTGVLACIGKRCVLKPGSIVQCDSSKDTACQRNLCGSTTGVCGVVMQPEAALCNDDDVCTGDDGCVKGFCVGKTLSCDDKNPCTSDSCDAKNGCSNTAQNGASCDDGNVCTKSDVCAVGACVGGDNACQCATSADCAPLEDGDRCNGTLVCRDSRCVVDVATVVVCAAPEQCSARVCAPKTGVCVSKPGQEGAKCTSAALCGGVGSCAAGVCVGTPDCADDGEVCTTVACDGKGSCVTTPVAGGCDDGEQCTDGDACANGVCVAGKNTCNCKKDVDCAGFDDGNLCTGVWTCGADGQCGLDVTTIVTCAPSSELCATQVCAPKTGTCQRKARANGSACVDGDACTTSEQCFGGNCVKKTIVCDDNDACTTDSCDPKKGCVSIPSTDVKSCDDGDPCTAISLCLNGACVGGPSTCQCQNNSDCKDDNDICNGVPTCQAGTCKAKAGSVVSCDTAGDGPCVTTQCVAATGACAPLPKVAGTTCSDNNACTAADVCSLGVCVGIPFGCDDGVACTKDACDAKLGCVSIADNARCADGNVCTANICSSDFGCSSIPASGSCSDGDACTVGDSCQNRVCVAGAPNTGCCKTGAACDDGDACTSKDVCLNNSCSGVKATCDDGNLCTNDSCDSAAGCVYKTNTSPCNDGDVCTLQDSCEAGKCVGKFKIPCDDGNPCTDDGCGLTGCTRVNNSASCSDGNACTIGDICAGGSCSGKAANCDDGNRCTTDFCDAAAGCKTVANTQACSDNSACTSGDVCSAGACVGKSVNCDDNNPCTQDLCLAASGCQNAAVANGRVCGQSGVCVAGTCSVGSDLNPGLSCKDILQRLPSAKTGLFFVDPDGAGPGQTYQVTCDMVAFGGGWMVLDVPEVARLMTMTSLVSGGGCVLSTTEWRTWDQFAGSTADHHFCVAEPKTGLVWPTYTEMRVHGVQLVGYTGGGNNTFDAYTDCYGASWQGNFCAGPSLELKSVNTSNIQLSNGQVSPTYNRSFVLSKPRNEFQIRTREEGPQLEGVIWKTGAILLR